jgi:peptide/nickel transport system substrate-binding protein
VLAQSWENPRPNEWRFHLRENVRFHDGSYLTPQAVKDALENVMRSQNLDTNLFLNTIQDIRAIDDRIISIITEKPFAMLSRVPFIYISKRNSQKSFPPLFGTGPYRLISWRKGQSVRLIRWENYWEKRPPFQEVTFMPVAQAKERMEQLRRGSVDIVYSVPADLTSEMPNVHFARRPGLTVYHLGFDLRPVPGNPFSDPRVRKAIHAALDRESIVKKVLHGYGTVPSQPVVPFVFGYNPSLPRPSQNLSLAKNLLAEAGYPTGIHARLDLIAARLPAARLIQNDLKKIGIDIDLNLITMKQIYDLGEQGKTNFYLIGWDCTSGDASEFYEFCAHTRDQKYGRGNYGYYSNIIPIRRWTAS